jgi:uncharacterized SAM-binding protein YcdF (DUF218 family)
VGILRRILLCFLACLGLWLGGLFWFFQQMPAADANPPRADAIVVFTGGPGRLEHGLELLVGNKGKVLFVSGVGKNVRLSELLSRTPSDIRTAVLHIPSQYIMLGHDAENTIGNAEETARWAARQKPDSILLVTAAYHMPRSLKELRELLPRTNIAPAAVFSDNINATWWAVTETRQLILEEYHKYLASIVRHWLIARGKSS